MSLHGIRAAAPVFMVVHIPSFLGIITVASIFIISQDSSSDKIALKMDTAVWLRGFSLEAPATFSISYICYTAYINAVSGTEGVVSGIWHLGCFETRINLVVKKRYSDVWNSCYSGRTLSECNQMCISLNVFVKVPSQIKFQVHSKVKHDRWKGYDKGVWSKTDEPPLLMSI